jgi:flagellar biosynthesis/type III secretory pathway protein FliH
MANIWDDLMKMLVRAHPQDFVSLVFSGVQYIGDVTNELKVRSVEADFLCNAKLGENDIVVHVEFQRRHDYTMQRRMWEYNSATDYLTGLPVHSFVVYLWEDEYVVDPIYRRVSGGEEIYVFSYKNIFLWKVPPEVLEQAGLEGMLPLLPLTRGAADARDEIIETMINRLREAHKEDVLALGYAFAGLVYDTDADQQWLKRRFQVFHDILEGSWSYREMVQKGIETGLEQGILKGIEKGIEQGIEKGIEQGIEKGIEQGIEKGIEQGIEKGIEQGIEKGIEQGIEKGIEQGIEKGIEQGIEKGFEEGELRALDALRPVLIHFVETRYPALTSLARQQSEQINKPELLSVVLDKLFIAQTQERAQQVLMEIHNADATPS